MMELAPVNGNNVEGNKQDQLIQIDKELSILMSDYQDAPISHQDDDVS